jgi:hypothetical protein
VFSVNTMLSTIRQPSLNCWHDLPVDGTQVASLQATARACNPFLDQELSAHAGHLNDLFEMYCIDSATDDARLELFQRPCVVYLRSCRIKQQDVPAVITWLLAYFGTLPDMRGIHALVRILRQIEVDAATAGAEHVFLHYIGQTGCAASRRLYQEDTEADRWRKGSDKEQQHTLACFLNLRWYCNLVTASSDGIIAHFESCDRAIQAEAYFAHQMHLTRGYCVNQAPCGQMRSSANHHVQYEENADGRRIAVAQRCHGEDHACNEEYQPLDRFKSDPGKTAGVRNLCKRCVNYASAKTRGYKGTFQEWLADLARHVIRAEKVVRNDGHVSERRCTICLKMLPATLEHFRELKKGTGRLVATCDPCRREYHTQWRHGKTRFGKRKRTDS